MTFGQFSIDYVFWGAILSTEIENDCWSYLLKTWIHIWLRVVGICILQKGVVIYMKKFGKVLPIGIDKFANDFDRVDSLAISHNSELIISSFEKIEIDLMKLFAKENWIKLSHLFIFLGRNILTIVQLN